MEDEASLVIQVFSMGKKKKKRMIMTLTEENET